MAKKSDHLADFATENTGGGLAGFLADEEHLDKRAMLRLGTWGAASVGAVIIAVLANQSSLRLRHDELAAADLSRQAQQIQSAARESQNETRRLASAIDTLNGDRDRMYSRLSTLEQGLDSVTGAIAKQNASAAPATPAPASAAPAASAPPVVDGATPAPAPEAAATETTPLIGPVATTSAVITGKQAAEARRREQANAKMAAAAPTPLPALPPAVPAQSSPPATTAAMPLVAAKSMMGPPDPAASKPIEPEPAKTSSPTTSSATTAATTVPTTPPQTAEATPAAAPESAAATPAIDKAAIDKVAKDKAADDKTAIDTAAIEKPASDKPAPEKTATAAPAPQTSPQLAVNRTEFGVDVGGANSVGGLRALWRGLLKSRSNAPLAALQPIIVIREGNNGLGMQLRLVAGPLTDAAAAAKICATLVENERPCSTAVYDGQHLALKTDDAPASTGTISPKASGGERSSEKPEAEKPAEKPRYGSGHQWRRHSYQKRAVVEEPPAEKPKPTTGSTFSSFFHRSN